MEKFLSKSIVLNIILLFAFLFAAQKLYAYINDKGVVGYEGNAAMANNLASASVMPAEQNGQNSDFATIDETNQSPSISFDISSQNPAHLLPIDTNSNISQLSANITGSFLSATEKIGTVANPKKIFNGQLRPLPQIPIRDDIGPWNNTTIEQQDILENNKGFQSLSLYE